MRKEGIPDYLAPWLEEVTIQAEKGFSYSPEGWESPDFGDDEEIW